LPSTFEGLDKCNQTTRLVILSLAFLLAVLRGRRGFQGARRLR
jgi:hypothetical protein